MALRVIGAGVGRTGTMSLKLALTRLLGGPCYHMVEVFPRPAHFGLWKGIAQGAKADWEAVFDGFVAAVDWPASAFWKEISEAYPDALILLSTRDPESWWTSASHTIFGSEPGGAPRSLRPGPIGEMLGAIFEARFTLRVDDKAAAIAAYERHNADVRARAPRDRLVEWSAEQGWGPLCEALRLPIPNEPFPHVNTTEEIRARMASGRGPPSGQPH